MDTFPICFVQISCFRSSDMTSWCLHAENSLFSHRVTGQECRFLGFWTQAVSALCILCLWLSHSSFRHLSLSQSLLVYLSLTHCQHSLSDMRFMFWEFDGELCAHALKRNECAVCMFPAVCGGNAAATQIPVMFHMFAIVCSASPGLCLPPTPFHDGQVVMLESASRLMWSTSLQNKKIWIVIRCF